MSKKIKVWGRVTSSNVKKVLWVAHALQLEIERVDAGGKFGVVDTPAYRALNPNGRIPTIEDGDLVLWDSNAIMRYLCETYRGEAIYPSDPRTRAEINRWLDWSLSIFVDRWTRNPFLADRPEFPHSAAWLSRVRGNHEGFRKFVEIPLE
jgi:glutathione S-transferase